MISNRGSPGTRITRTTGIQATKKEPNINLPINTEQQSIDLVYEIDELKDILQIERVVGDCIEIEYPVTNVSQFNSLLFIESQFAAANAVSNPDPDLVDTTILSAMPYFLAEEGVELPDDPILAARVMALIYQQARGIKSRTNLLKYLDENLKTAQKLGLKSTDGESVVSESTLSRAAQEYRIDRQAVQNAILRLQHTLFRNGLLFNRLTNIGYIENQPIPPASHLSDQQRCQGLVNYSDLLLRQVSDISLRRGPGVKYTPRDIIAALAQMALHDVPSKGRQLGKWHYKNDIITFQRIKQIISENFYRDNILLAKSSIEKLDKKLHRAIFQFADDIGFFEHQIDVALDPTWVPVTETVADTPGAIKNPTISDEAEGGFTFPMAVSFTPMASLSLGVKYVTDKAQYPNAFRQLLSRTKEFGELGWILADREFDSAKMISLLRSAAGRKWIIRVREHHEVISKDVSQALEEVGKAQVSIGDHKVNVFSKGFTTSDHPSLAENENLILLSDMPIEKTNPSSLVDKYLRRWSVETYIRQIKHSFSPKVEQEQAPINQFLFTVASAFYNIWAIINQSVSPMYGLRLEPRYYNVLKSIVQSTFPDRRQFYSQIDMMYQ